MSQIGAVSPDVIRSDPTATAGPAAPADSHHKQQFSRLMWFFAIVYMTEGLGQAQVGLISQPVNYYLKQVFGWTPVQVTAYLTVLTLPWLIKPLYGMFSDFVPLFGYRRKAYLIVSNAAAAIAYFWITQVTQPGAMVTLLALTAYGMAISSTLCGAVLVENGQKFRASGAFVNQQWLWFNIAAVASSAIGGFLVQRLAPVSALHWAAAIVGAAPFAVVFGSVFLISEERTPIRMDALKSALRGFLATFRSRPVLIVALFLFFYNFSPGFATPLYYYMTDTLKFSQGFIGVLGSISSVGWIVGAFIYSRLLKHMTSKRLLNLSIALGVAGNLAFLFFSGEATAIVAYFGSGIAAMIAYVASLTLAADYCPRKSEGFAYAILMSVANLAGTASDNAGSYLFEHVFASRLTPLIWVSAAFTALAFVLIPILRLGNKRQGEPIAVRT
jgi:MFS family permease